MSKPSGVTLVVCEELHLRVHVCMLCILSVRVGDILRDEVQEVMQTHTQLISLTHSVCFSLYPSPAVIGPILSPC